MPTVPGPVLKSPLLPPSPPPQSLPPPPPPPLPLLALALALTLALALALPEGTWHEQWTGAPASSSVRTALASTGVMPAWNPKWAFGALPNGLAIRELKKASRGRTPSASGTVASPTFSALVRW